MLKYVFIEKRSRKTTDIESEIGKLFNFSFTIRSFGPLGMPSSHLRNLKYLTQVCYIYLFFIGIDQVTRNIIRGQFLRIILLNWTYREVTNRINTNNKVLCHKQLYFESYQGNSLTKFSILAELVQTSTWNKYSSEPPLNKSPYMKSALISITVGLLIFSRS